MNETKVAPSGATKGVFKYFKFSASLSSITTASGKIVGTCTVCKGNTRISGRVNVLSNVKHMRVRLTFLFYNKRVRLTFLFYIAK